MNRRCCSLCLPKMPPSQHMDHIAWSPGQEMKPPLKGHGIDDNIDVMYAKLVDVIGIMFFALVMMFKFWIKAALYVIWSFHALRKADREIQITLVFMAILILSSITFNTVFGKRYSVRCS
ncbi:uncharacterized protein LOC119649440 isoform X1 [Hermetia illucens]|uniref:uncharacterized protein LOC119649440 isoform X1 n=1 Tax=Hermetia illucens TaxID=343691 RepID=UPI0018CC0564|nr:uncharacterized protein LOC119649440 isoform X1 [Hermetia illucens]